MRDRLEGANWPVFGFNVDEREVARIGFLLFSVPAIEHALEAAEHEPTPSPSRAARHALARRASSVYETTHGSDRGDPGRCRPPRRGWRVVVGSTVVAFAGCRTTKLPAPHDRHAAGGPGRRYGDTAAQTPVMDRLAARGRAIPTRRRPRAQHGPSHASILTGRFTPSDTSPQQLRRLPGPQGRPHPRHAAFERPGLPHRRLRLGAFPARTLLGLDRGSSIYDDPFGPERERHHPRPTSERPADKTPTRPSRGWTSGSRTSRPASPGSTTTIRTRRTSRRRTSRDDSPASPYDGEIAYRRLPARAAPRVARPIRRPEPTLVARHRGPRREPSASTARRPRDLRLRRDAPGAVDHRGAGGPSRADAEGPRPKHRHRADDPRLRGAADRRGNRGSLVAAGNRAGQ